MDEHSTDVAAEGMVFMVVSLDSHWKMPCVYFISGMAEKEEANVVKLCLTKPPEAGVRVVSLTCDGLSCNFAMFKDLGRFISG